MWASTLAMNPQNSLLWFLRARARKVLCGRGEGVHAPSGGPGGGRGGPGRRAAPVAMPAAAV